MSPAIFRRHSKPRLAKMFDLMHSFGVKVLFHSDSAIRPLIGDLIGIGIDILNPVQWCSKGRDRAAPSAISAVRWSFTPS